MSLRWQPMGTPSIAQIRRIGQECVRPARFCESAISSRRFIGMRLGVERSRWMKGERRDRSDLG
jgi:hypothetical protein